PGVLPRPVHEPRQRRVLGRGRRGRRARRVRRRQLLQHRSQRRGLVRPVSDPLPASEPERLRRARLARRDAPVVTLLLAGLAAARLGCGGGVPAALDDAAAGRRPLAGIRLDYREERPLRGDVRVAVAGDGTATITAETLRPGCADPRAADCRTTTTRAAT